MKNKAMLGLGGLATVALLAMGITGSSAAGSWTYTGATGASHWGDLDSSFITCVDGTAQSPINLVRKNTVLKDYKNLKFSYAKGTAGIFNNGHTVEAEPLVEGEGVVENTVNISGVTYPFLQFHFHAPSEHEVNGMHYPLEVHFVHKTEAGKIAVVGVFVKAGKTNDAWAPFIAKMNDATSDPEATTTELDWAKLLPTNPETMRYNGSLTTPGCTEGVKWNVFTHPVTMSQAQINEFLEAYSGNNRPVQPLHGRKIYLDSTLKK
jgi:carbonic anhydrase